MTTSTRLLIYDGACPICSDVADRIHECSRGVVRTLPLASEEAHESLTRCYPDGYERGFYFINPSHDSGCRSRKSAIGSVFATLGVVGSAKLVASRSFWRAGRKMFSRQPSSCCGGTPNGISRRSFLTKIGLGSVGAAAGVTGVAAALHLTKPKKPSRAIVDPVEHSSIVKRVGAGADYKNAFATLRERGFAPKYPLEEAVPLRQHVDETGDEWTQIVIPFFKEGVPVDQLTAEDVAAVVVDADESRVAALALQITRNGLVKLQPASAGAISLEEKLVWGPITPGANHMWCLARLFIFGGPCIWRINFCDFLCFILAAFGAAGCGLICKAVEVDLGYSLVCATLCGAVIKGTCGASCEAIHGH